MAGNYVISNKCTTLASTSGIMKLRTTSDQQMVKLRTMSGMKCDDVVDNCVIWNKRTKWASTSFGTDFLLRMSAQIVEDLDLSSTMSLISYTTCREAHGVLCLYEATQSPRMVPSGLPAFHGTPFANLKGEAELKGQWIERGHGLTTPPLFWAPRLLLQK